MADWLERSLANCECGGGVAELTAFGARVEAFQDLLGTMPDRASLLQHMCVSDLVIRCKQMRQVTTRLSACPAEQTQKLLT